MDVDLRLGAEVAGHRLERVIGRGGMSVVFLAEHLRLNRKVAFKVLAPHLTDDPGFRDRFIRESRTAAGLDHPNIVTVYDAGEADGILYISMRYVEGSDLGRVLAEGGAVEPWRTLTILAQIGSALDAAHVEGLVHRDVKPGNILLGQPGSQLDRAYLSDFGVTKRMTTREALTRTGQFVGTVDYVAPEQILGESIDGRTDVYSLGCVLYQCLTGVAPFPRPTDVATIYAHLHDPTPTFPPGVFSSMDPVIGRALAKAKEDRFPSCTALVDAARSQLHGDAVTEVLATPTAVRDETAVLDAPRRRRGRRLAAILGAGVLAAAIVGLVIASREDGGSGAASPSNSSPSPSPGGGIGAIVWTKADWNKFGHGIGQVALTDAIVTNGHHVVAVGHADNRANEDAAVWMQRDKWQRTYLSVENGSGDQRSEGIAQVGDRLIVVGYDGANAAGWYSDDDGTSWNAVTGLESGSDARTVVQSADGVIWALGREVVWSSSDGAAWTVVPTTAFPEGAIVYGAATVDQRVVAVGSVTGGDGLADAAVWMLGDGAWSRVDPASFDASGAQFLIDVAVDPGSGRMVAAGVADQGAMIWTSADGSTWRPAGGSLGTAPSQEVNSVIYMSGHRHGFLAAGWTGPESESDGAVWTSDDGETWSPQRGPNQIGALAGGGAQQIRVLVQYESTATDVLALGTEGSERTSLARLWNGLLASR